MTNYKDSWCFLSLLLFSYCSFMCHPVAHFLYGLSCLKSSAQCQESCFQFIVTIQLLFRYLLSSLHQRRFVWSRIWEDWQGRHAPLNVIPILLWGEIRKLCNSSIVRRGWFSIEIRRGGFSTDNTNDITRSVTTAEELSLQLCTSDVIAQFYSTFINSLLFFVNLSSWLSIIDFISSVSFFVAISNSLSILHTSSVTTSFHLVRPTSFQI
jgi:hypothetical protein